jgi:hypothetical protein
MNMEYVKQCILKNENLTTVAWITEVSAEVGKWVELKEDQSQWRVMEVGKNGIEMSEALSKAHEDQKIFGSIQE